MSENAIFLDFYTRFHLAAGTSEANARFCEEVYGKNLYQQGFAEMAHLDHLMTVTGIQADQQVLDMGCGNGRIAEYLSDQTGAVVTGIDLIPGAVHTAETRTQTKRDRLNFQVMDIAHLDFPRASFDVVLSIDTLYFSDLDQTLLQMVALLKPDGCMGIFYAQSCLPWINLDTFPKETVQPDLTDLAVSLQGMNLPYRVWDYTDHDYAHARRRKKVLAELKYLYQQEDNLFLYESYLGEANGVMCAYENGVHGRYLYLVRPSS